MIETPTTFDPSYTGVTTGAVEANSAVTAYPITNNGGTFKPGGAARRVFTAIGASGSYTQNTGSLEIDVASPADYDGLDLTIGGASTGKP